MAVNPLTPGVYIDEISVFPPSVAPVATAIPAFIGYTEKAIVNGTPWNFASGVAPAVRITSMLEFEKLFGVAFPELFTATVTGSTATVAPTSPPLSEFTMHYNLRMYFANGGGPCYIVAADSYANSGGTITHTKLINGIGATERADEVTLLVVPEAIASTISSAQRALVHSTALDLCNKLKDRFTIMDVIANPAQTIMDDADDFRSTEVGNNNLKYGAAYYPALDTVLTRFYKDSDVSISGGTFNTKKLSDVLDGLVAVGSFQAGTLPLSNEVTPTEIVKVAGKQFQAVASGPSVSPLDDPYKFLIGTNNTTAAANLATAINTQAVTSLLVVAAPSTNVVNIKAKVSGTAGNSIALVQSTNITRSGATLTGGIDADRTLYNNITLALLENTMELYPSSTVAGIYAGVDRDRGVWKAPANVSIAGVIAPSINISAADQENLNVDATSGKSINAIRTFTGKGILVWGARTLAGNDNEWRYVSVRRLFIFAEESIQKASEFVVFEPNDRNTWTRVKTLISNFLTNLWRDGALAGATPKEAYFVKVGLGETMTAQDILEGKLIIQVGLAAVRPAEFIILQFSHKLQES
jgi:phage tail sheath protein FI